MVQYFYEMLHSSYGSGEKTQGFGYAKPGLFHKPHL
jgi:hypothetical protein